MNIFLACFLGSLFASVIYGLGFRSFMAWRMSRFMKRSMSRPTGLGDFVGGLPSIPPMPMNVQTGQELLVLSPGKPVDLLAANSGCEIRLHLDNGDKWTGRIEAVQVSDPPLVVSSH